MHPALSLLILSDLCCHLQQFQLELFYLLLEQGHLQQRGLGLKLPGFVLGGVQSSHAFRGYLTFNFEFGELSSATAHLRGPEVFYFAHL